MRNCLWRALAAAYLRGMSSHRPHAFARGLSASGFFS